MEFISGNKIESDRQQVRAARQQILEKAKRDFFRKQQIEERKRQRGDDVWILPSIDKRIKDDSGDINERKKKKSKKSKKSKHKKSKRKAHHERSMKQIPDSDEESNEDSDSQWVEKLVDDNKGQSVTDSQQQSGGLAKRDDWMLHSHLFDDISQRSKERDILKPIKEDKKETAQSDLPGQHPKELNPYWKNNGTGLPEDNVKEIPNFSRNRPESSSVKKDNVVADRLQLAKDRWKLAKLQKEDTSATSVAEKNNSKTAKKFSRPGTSPASLPQQMTSKRHGWMKQGHTEYTNESENTLHSKESAEDLSRLEFTDTLNHVDKQESITDESSSSDSECCSSYDEAEEKSTVKIATTDDLNVISSKIFRAELMGDMELANKLKQQLETARLAKDDHQMRLVVTKPKSGNNADITAESTSKENVIYLSRKSASGMEIPLKNPNNPNYGKLDHRRKKIKTHSLAGDRERYFADDDKHDLKALFQHEKEGNSLDYNNVLSRLSNKGRASVDSENFTLDDMFESSLARELTPGQKYEHEKRKATIEQHKLMEKQSKCPFCIDSSIFEKHLLIALGIKVYLSLPSHRPLTDGHCFIVTMAHELARTALDEDVLHEINVYRKGLTKMFAEKGMTAIFIETCINIRRHRHLCIQCLPVPQEIGDMSPIYFKKAIQESDTEWSQNKKLISFSEAKLTHSIPKGFPYFAVEFELNGGFAHVIEDEDLFPYYFGQEIIGGMLDVDPYLWRRPPKENFSQQQKRVIEFSKWWKPYDWTQKIER